MASTPLVQPMRTVTAVRYVTPLREGGSLPAIVEADDGQLYVVKFRGAGQGTKALIAELIAGEVARALALPVPEPVLIQLDTALARTEGDEEVGDLLQASVGVNFGLGYLPGSVTFTRGADQVPSGALASAIVWLDAYLMNVDRTVKNPNLLCWQQRLWLIDHGAALYWHHGWEAGGTNADRSGDPFKLIRNHVLLPWADALAQVGRELAARLSDERIDAAVAQLPADWFTDGPEREVYRLFLRRRRDDPSPFVQEAIDARAHVV
jgi:hypothetical protein